MLFGLPLFSVTLFAEEPEEALAEASAETPFTAGPYQEDFEKCVALMKRGKVEQVRELVRKLPMFAEDDYPCDHEEIYAMTGLMRLFHAVGDLRESNRILQRILNALEERPIEGIHTLVFRMGLADNYMSEGRYDEAEAIILEELTKFVPDENGEFESPAELASSQGLLYLGLAQMYREQELYVPAENYYRAAFQFFIKNPAMPIIGVSSDWAQMATEHLHFELGEKLYEFTIEFLEDVEATEEPLYMQSLMGLSHTYVRTGRHKPLRKILPKLLARLEAESEPSLNLLENLGEAYRELGQTKQADELYKKYLARIVRAHGEEHETSIAMLNLFAHNDYEQERYAESEPHYRKLLQIKEKRYGENAFETSLTVNYLAGVLTHQGKYDEAQKLYQRLDAIYQTGEINPYYASIWFANWAELYRKTGESFKALDCAKKAMNLSLEGVLKAFRTGCARDFSMEGHEQMIALHYVHNDQGNIFEAMEECAFLRYMNSAQVKWEALLKDVPEEQAAPLKEQILEAANQQRILETMRSTLASQHLVADDDTDDASKIAFSTEELQAERERVATQLLEAEKHYSEVRVKISELSPNFRTHSYEELGRFSLKELQKRLDEHKAVLLLYHIGNENSYLLVLGAAMEPKTYLLELDEKQAKSLNVKKGPFTGEKFFRLLAQSGMDTIIVDDSDPLKMIREDTLEKAALERMHSLFQVLIPGEELQKTITEKGRFDMLAYGGNFPMDKVYLGKLKTDASEEQPNLFEARNAWMQVPSATFFYNMLRPQEDEASPSEPRP